MHGEVGKEVRKFEKTMDALCVKNVALEVKVANLQATVSIKKAKRKRGKTLINRITQEGKVLQRPWRGTGGNRAVLNQYPLGSTLRDLRDSRSSTSSRSSRKALCALDLING